MRLVTAFLILGMAATLRAAEPKQIVNEAIAAQAGSVERLARIRTAHTEASGSMFSPNGELKMKRFGWVDWPNSFRLRFELDFGNNDVRAVEVCVAEGGAWKRSGPAPAVAMPPADLQEIMGDLHVYDLMTLLPLRDEKVTLTGIGASRVNGKPVQGILAEQKGLPDVKLFFDDESHLLTRVSYEGKDAGVKVVKDFLLSDYKTFDGVQMPTRLREYHDRKPTPAIDLTIDKYTFQAKPDPKWFAKP